MIKTHEWKIGRQSYNLLCSEDKTIVVMVGKGDVPRTNVGDMLVFKGYAQIMFEVIRTTRYSDLETLLDTEDASRIMPGMSKYKAYGVYRDMYPEEEEKSGVYAIEVKRKTGATKIYKLSSLMCNRKAFDENAKMAYNITAELKQFYPNHQEWYWKKQIPRVLDGTGEIIICMVGDKIVGVTFLKKDNSESKLCTFYVLHGYRTENVLTKLLQNSYNYLGTTKPLFSISEPLKQSFDGIVKTYNWELMQILGAGYYNVVAREFVYNGYIAK